MSRRGSALSPGVPPATAYTAWQSFTDSTVTERRA